MANDQASLQPRTRRNYGHQHQESPGDNSRRYLNLLSNAIKFNHDGGKVEIRAEPYDEDRVKLLIIDTGIGIQAEDVERLFKESEQLEFGASRHHEGTGVGLALTRKIVELQGGTISVASEFGKGSSFTIVLPSVTAEVKV